MVWHPTRQAVLSLWGRRWVRRIAYTLVAGSTLLTVTPWVATRPAVMRWSLGHLDAFVQRETGLSLEVEGLELQPALGRLVLKGVRLGGDLLAVDRVEVQVDLLGLWKPGTRLRALRLERPRLRLTEAGLARIRLRPRPPRTEPLPRVQVELLSLTGGDLDVPEPLRGVPALRFQFDLKGTSPAPNQLRVDLAGAQLAVRGPAGWEKGRLDVNGLLSEEEVRVNEAYLRLADSQLRITGRLGTRGPRADANPVEARLSGVVDLAQGARWAGSAQAPLAGSLDLVATLQGSLQHPTWTFGAEGQAVRPAGGSFQPGSLLVKAEGTLQQAQVETLAWTSDQGHLAAQGRWSRTAGAEGTLEAAGLDLEALGQSLRLAELTGVRASLQGRFQGPLPGSMAAWTVDLGGSLRQGDREAGALDLRLREGSATLSNLRVDLPDLQVEAHGEARLAPRGLAWAQGDATVAVGAGQVARALRSWSVVDLDMEGRARVQGKGSWRASEGLDLHAAVAVEAPRWKGAHADTLAAEVTIQGSDLRVDGVEVRKGEGRATGSLWLTWAPQPPGGRQIDMCFQAHRLPVAEGLRAAPVTDGEGRELPLDGLASGWVRFEGPFRTLSMNGHAEVVSGECYGLTLPSVSSDFSMDLKALRLTLEHLRVADAVGLPEGPAPREGATLDLAGRADMDFDRWTWWVDLGGRLDTQLLGLPGPRLQARVEGRLLGPITEPFGALDLPQGQVVLDQGRLFFGERSVSGLEGRLALDSGRLAARVAMTGFPRPLVDVKVDRKGTGLEGTVDLEVSPASAATPALARGLTGDLLEDLDLHAAARGRWAQGRTLAWTGSLDRFSARFNAFDLHQATPTALAGTAEGTRLDLTLEGGARTPTGGTQAASLRLTGALPFRSTAPVALEAQGTADLGHLKTILDRVMEVDEYSVLSGLQVAGTSRFNLRLHGSFGDPLLDGALDLEQGRARLRGYQGLEDLRGRLELQDRAIRIPAAHPVKGTLAHGDLTLQGGLTWQPGGLDAYAFQASLAHFQLRDLPEGLDLQGSLRATLEGTEDGGLLKGTLRADRLSYQSEIKLSDLILRSALADTGALASFDMDDPLEQVRLDLDLDLRNPWSFDTNLLKLEGRTEGAFQVQGTLAHPIPRGRLVFQPGGRLTNIFPAGDMVVDRGSLEFSESRRLDPLIALHGSLTSIPGYTVNLDIRGTLSNLSIIPSSTPSLRQDEIIAILINPGNAATVGTASATSGATQGAITSGLAGAGSGLLSTLAFAPFQEQLRRTLGLDRVNVAVRTTTLGTTETEVTLGKSLNLLGQRSAFVVSNRKSGELNVLSGQVEWRFGGFVLQLGASKGGSDGAGLSGEIRHTWSPK